MPGSFSGKRAVFSKPAAGKTKYAQDKKERKKERKKFDPYITSDTKINSKWIKDLNVTGNAIKLLEGNRVKLHNIELGDDLVDMAPKAQAGKKIRYIGLHQT